MTSAATSAPAAVRVDGTIGTPPESWVQAFMMSRYQFRDYLRSRRFLLMMGMMGAISVILLTLVAYYRPASVIGNGTDFFGSLWALGATVLTLFSVIVYGGDAIAGEFQNRTGYFLMGLPIKRWTVYAGKFMASFAAAMIAIALYFFVLVFSCLYFVGIHSLFAGAFESFALVMLYLAAVLGTTFLFSSMFKTSMYGVIIVVIMFLFGFSLIEGIVEGLLNITPWFIITWASPVVFYPITGVPASAGMRFGHIVFDPTYWQGIGVMLGYFVGTTAGGLLLFDREEFT